MCERQHCGEHQAQTLSHTNFTPKAKLVLMVPTSDHKHQLCVRGEVVAQAIKSCSYFCFRVNSYFRVCGPPKVLPGRSWTGSRKKFEAPREVDAEFVDRQLKKNRGAKESRRGICIFPSCIQSSPCAVQHMYM